MTTTTRILILSEEQAQHGIEAHGWKVVAATTTGATHERKGETGQDVYAVGLEPGCLVAAVCDGAGSAVRGLEGARVASRLVVEGLLDRLGALPPSAITENTVKDQVVACILQARQVVMRLGALNDYAATLVGMIATTEGGYFFHVGDGAGVTLSSTGEGTSSVMTRPETGEYINETYFFTDGHWQDHLRTTAFGQAEVVLIMSDGVTPFALLPNSVGVDERFVLPVCRYLRESDPEQGERALSATLRCENAGKVSDDDKTLIYIERTGRVPQERG